MVTPSGVSLESVERQYAVLFADVSGSTRLYEQIGDAAALATIGRCLALAQSVAEGHGGRLVKTIGDEAMIVFDAADAATEAAGEIQARMAALPAQGGVRVSFRMGLHRGSAIERDGDLYGDSVNVAARMVALAKGGQVILSGAVAEALSPWQRRRLREVDVLTVKGKQQDIRIFELLWQEASDEVTALATRPAVRAARLQLKLGAHELDLDEQASTLTFGRDPQCNLVVADRMASRLHGRIERRRDKFVVVDQSSNGTYVTIDGEREIALRREEMILRGRGRISFGHAYANDPTGTLTFVCVDDDA